MEIRGLNKDNIIKLSGIKKEPKWVLDFRLDAYKSFKELEEPKFTIKDNIDYDNLLLYKSDYKEEFDYSSIDSMELEGTLIQLESETIYKRYKDELDSKGVIFCSMEDAIKNHSDLVKKYLGSVIKSGEHRYTALNSALFSGGAFIYIPKGVKLDKPLQSYFRITTDNLGQFERTLIIVEEGGEFTYIEGCTAKINFKESLHAANVEVILKKKAKCKFVTIQNWSLDVINMVTERSYLDEDAEMLWVDGNLGSKVTYKYPSCILKGNNSKGSLISIAVSKDNMIQEGGSNMIHLGKNTKSRIVSKSISMGSGEANYRGHTIIKKEAINSKAYIKCDSLLLDKDSKSYSYPDNKVYNNSSSIYHEAKISAIDVDKLFYLESKGINKEKAENLMIVGFLDVFKNELPMEYAVELSRLIQDYFL